jgi:hypothetical protein
VRTRLLAALAAASLLALTGCSSDDSSSVTDEAAMAERGSDDAAGGTDGSFSGLSTGGGVAGSMDGADAPAEGEESGGDAVLTGTGIPLGRQVIQTADLRVRSNDPSATIDEIVAVVTRAGGFVAGTQLDTVAEGVLSGSVTVRVPADRLGATLDALAGAADEVVSRELRTEDVTGQLSDIDAQLRNLRALETELVALLADVRERSNSADQVLVVFERLRQVRGEIETLDGRRATLGDLVALSTVTVWVEPTEAALPVRTTETGWAPGRVVRDAWASTVVMLQSIADLAIRFVVTALPVLLVLAAPVVGAVAAG